MSSPCFSERVALNRSSTDVVVCAPMGKLQVHDLTCQGLKSRIAAQTVALICIRDALMLIRVLAALDGRISGMLLVSASLPSKLVFELAQNAGTTIIISDRDDLTASVYPDKIFGEHRLPAHHSTRWMMTTSGTTGTPKIVVHSLDSLSRTVQRDPLSSHPIWGLIYDITRFAGMQVALQSLLGGGLLAVATPDASTTDQISWLAQMNCSHLSATPTLWRRMMMVPDITELPLRQITLGGEIVDQKILDALGQAFPKARVTHIYASTEAGVGFAVNDRKAGFPLSVQKDGTGVKVSNGRLMVRPAPGMASGALRMHDIRLDADGYMDTGDLVQVKGDRGYFQGRNSSQINIGGVKVSPEHVERVIAAVEGVAIAKINAIPNPITGALLVAQIMPEDGFTDHDLLKKIIFRTCHAQLSREAMPVRIQFTDMIKINSAGKMPRAIAEVDF